jgi:hypothetical protein
VAPPVVLYPYSFPFCSTKPSPSEPNNLEHHGSLLASMAAWRNSDEVGSTPEHASNAAKSVRTFLSTSRTRPRGKSDELEHEGHSPRPWRNGRVVHDGDKAFRPIGRSNV